MRLAFRCTVMGLLVANAMAWGCGARPPEIGLGFGTVGGGGGTEIFDGGETTGFDASGFSSSGASSGSTGNGGTSGAGASGRTGSGASGGQTGTSGTSSGSTSGNTSSGSTGTTSGASGTSGSGRSSGAIGASGSSGSSRGGASGSSAASGEPADAGDAGSGGIILTLGGSIHLASLDWKISGPNTYEGSVEFGDAHSFEWIVGGIAAAAGYTLSVTATDTQGNPCQGASAPFDVQAGISTYTMITIVCETATAADVTTGSVVIEAGVVAASD